jgi:GNAT superfamily N-acetyltransferase
MRAWNRNQGVRLGWPDAIRGKDSETLLPSYRLAPLRWDDQRAVAELLVRAFAEDPLVRAICGPADRRGRRRMFWSFLVSVRAHALSPQPAYAVRSASGAIVAVALLSRPGIALEARADPWVSLWAVVRMGREATRRSIEAAKAIARHVPRFPLTYVRTLAVDPAHQRRGLGSALLDEVLRRSPPSWPLYLETAREANVRFYERNGFACAGSFRCLGVDIWRMLHPPVASGEQRAANAEKRRVANRE